MKNKLNNLEQLGEKKTKAWKQFVSLRSPIKSNYLNHFYNASVKLAIQLSNLFDGKVYVMRNNLWNLIGCFIIKWSISLLTK